MKAVAKEEVAEQILNPFGTTFEITVDNYLGVKKCVIPFPDRKTFFSIMKMISSDKDDSEYTVGEKILSSMQSGDTEFLSDDIYILMGSIEALKEFEIRSAFIKKK